MMTSPVMLNLANPNRSEKKFRPDLRTSISFEFPSLPYLDPPADVPVNPFRSPNPDRARSDAPRRPRPVYPVSGPFMNQYPHRMFPDPFVVALCSLRLVPQTFCAA